MTSETIGSVTTETTNDLDVEVVLLDGRGFVGLFEDGAEFRVRLTTRQARRLGELLILASAKASVG